MIEVLFLFVEVILDLDLGIILEGSFIALKGSIQQLDGIVRAHFFEVVVDDGLEMTLKFKLL